MLQVHIIQGNEIMPKKKRLREKGRRKIRRDRVYAQKEKKDR